MQRVAFAVLGAMVLAMHAGEVWAEQPDIDVSPGSLDVTAAHGDVPTRILTVRNQGPGDLNWKLWNEPKSGGKGGKIMQELILRGDVKHQGPSVRTTPWIGTRAAPDAGGGKTHPLGFLKFDTTDGYLVDTVDITSVLTKDARGRVRSDASAWDGEQMWVVDFQGLLVKDRILRVDLSTLSARVGL